MSKYLILVVLVAALSKTTWAIDEDCNYYQNLTAGIKYYVYNPGYPNSYTGERLCRWYASSATKVQLTCQIFSLPSSANCAWDNLSISPSGDAELDDGQSYCGTGAFTIKSTGNSMNIIFSAFTGTTGGSFLCTLEATTPTPPSCNCGWKKQTRIMGGTVTGVNEYPMMAGVVNMDLQLLYCGATIISEKHVLSAAHCRPANKPVSKFAVLIGEHDISIGTETAATSLHTISSFVSHPMYDSNTQVNDIAVITVTDKIVFTPNIGPACLPFRHASATFVGFKVDVLGWGALRFGGEKTNVLRKVQLDVTELSQCLKIHPEVTGKELCTFTHGKDACQFDDGGPLLWKNEKTARLVLAGIISHGSQCLNTTPGMNIRVGSYLDWILSVTPGVDYCRVE